MMVSLDKGPSYQIPREIQKMVSSMETKKGNKNNRENRKTETFGMSMIQGGARETGGARSV